MRLWLLVVLLVLAGLCYGALRPVCVPLTSEDLALFTSPPIEQRTDRDFYLQIFQLRNSQWHQCKTWVSRQFFF